MSTASNDIGLSPHFGVVSVTRRLGWRSAVLIGSIGRIAGWIAAIACIACCLSGCAPQTDIANRVVPLAQPGTFFVAKPGAEGIYIEMSGTILELDCNDMEAEVDGKHMLFARRFVRRVTVRVSLSLDAAPTRYDNHSDPAWIIRMRYIASQAIFWK